MITLCENQEYAIKMAQRIRAATKALIHKDNGREISVTLSAGLAFREKNENFDLLINRTDKKLYEAKQRGRDRLVY